MNGDQRTSAQEVWPTAQRRRTIRFGDGESRVVAMEHWYWTALDEIAGHESMTCDELVREIDRRRGDGALVAALQLFCVSYFQRAVMGVPYQNVTGDMTKVNYSSSRTALLEFRRRVEALQHSVLVFQLCRPVWECWLATAVLAGALDLPGYARDPAPYRAVKWIPPRWEWVDPLKDRKAEREAVDAGFKARSDVIEAEGYDPEEVDARIAADREREKRLGLAFAPARAGDAVSPPDMGTPDHPA